MRGRYFYVLTLIFVTACGGSEPEIPNVEAGAGSTGAVRDTSPDESDVAAAASVIRGYYDAIDSGDYERAYLLWGDSGRASNQTFDEFRAGFANTESVALTIGQPGQVEGAAGSRFLEIPVEIMAVTRSDSVQRFAGRYVLRRVVVDGATEAQMRWHLSSATLEPCPGECGASGEEAGDVEMVVRGFGERLRLVSTLGPREDAARAIREHYAPFVTPELLERWVQNPAGAPGREVSNPWPRGIDVVDVAGTDDVKTVSGTVALVTTSDTTQVVERDPVTIQLVRSGDGRWRISSVTG